MRVLHVYSGNLYGGVEAMLAAFARARGAVPEMETHFALCFEGRLSRELREAGAPVYRLGRVRAAIPWTVFRARKRLRRVLRTLRPDAVVCHSAWSHGIFAPSVRRAKVPLAFWLHDAVNTDAREERRAARTPPDVAVCTSAFTRETLPGLFPDVVSHVVHPAVPSPPVGPVDRAAVRAELGTAPDAAVIVQVSRMEAWKGHRVLVEALGNLRDDPHWTCWMVGGAQRPHEREHLGEMQDLARRLGVAERIVFTGERRDVPRLLAAADVHCQANLGPEPFGITYVEAMHAGLPVVAAALGGAREIVDDSVGILVPPDDPPALADALRRLVDDPDLRSSLGAAGPARARELCDPAGQMRKLGTILDGVMAENAA